MTPAVRKPGFRIGRSYAVRFSPDGTQLAAIGRNVVLWDVAGRARRAFAHPFSHPSDLAFSPDGDQLVVKSTGSEIALLDAGSLDVVVRHGGEHRSEHGPVFSACGRYLVDGAWGGDLVVRDASTCEITWHEPVPERVSTRIACSPDRRTWAVFGQLYWEEGRPRRSLVDIYRWLGDPGLPLTLQARWVVPDAVYAVAVNPQASRLALAVRTMLAIWDIEQPEPDGAPVTARRRLELSPRVSLAWHPEGRLLVVGGAQDGTVELVDDELQPVWQTELGYSCDCSFSPDGRLLALGAWDGGIVVAVPDPAAVS